MKIAKALFAPGTSAFFFDDQRAIKKGAHHDGFIYEGKPVTPGFKTIRKAGQSISIMLVLEDGQVALGDCAAVQYSGAGGRDPLFLAETYIPYLNEHLGPILHGMDLIEFPKMAQTFEALTFNGKIIHTALRYGISQALLDARAKELNKMKCEVLCEEYGLPVILEKVPIFGQCGDDRYSNVDKMILKEADVLPHGLINNIDEKLGRNGEKLREYIRWLVKRIKQLGPDPSYKPSIHLDVYGTIGIIFDMNIDRITDYMASLEKDSEDFPLYIEGPVDVEEKMAQIDILSKITQKLESKGSSVKTVADEWCNTYEDIKDFADARACHMVQIKTPDLGGVQNIVKSILYCKEHKIEAYQGGTCNETDISAKTCVHIAFAARADRILAKPGMGFDEGFTIVKNEMERIMTILKYKKGDQCNG